MQHFRRFQRRLVEGERLFAFLDDVHVTTPNPDRVGPIHRVLDAELYRHARICINGCKTPSVELVWHPPTILRWHKKWTQVPGFGGIRFAGSATRRHRVGHTSWQGGVCSRTVERDHDTLLSRIPLVADVQSASALLLHCAGGPITCCEWSDLNWSTISLKATSGVVEMFGTHHPDKWQQHPCLWPWAEWVCAMSLALVSLLFGPAGLTVCPWSMTEPRCGHDDGPAAERSDCESPSLQAASRAARELTGLACFEVPSWDALV